MADSISKVERYSTSISNKVGEGARLAQLELIPERGSGFEKAAKKAGLALRASKGCTQSGKSA